jgi:ribosomal protein S18 acetylase RimI-like enzyme
VDTTTLLHATAANHRAWFRRQARAVHGRLERVGGVDMTVDEWGATIAFPRSRRVEATVERIRELRLQDASCWSLAPDAELGTRLVARGFGWGWQPHWMALDLARTPDDDGRHGVVVRHGRIPKDVPYALGEIDPPATVHLAVRRGGEIVGHAAVNPWRGVAGIYSMGVAPAHRREGIGRALTIAAARVAAERGCSHAVLNATDEGERLYRSLGFESLGWGQTWWYGPGREPTPRQTALAEAIGFGDIAALAALHPSPAELTRRLPGDTSPLRLALVTGRLAAAAWMLDRAPALARRRFEPFGGTLLHLAVEWNRPEFVRLALASGADTAMRDRTWDATPLRWTEHFERPDLARLLGPNDAPTPR